MASTTTPSATSPWIRYKDKASGEYYYHHKLSGETTWEAPAEGFVEPKTRKAATASLSEVVAATSNNGKSTTDVDKNNATPAERSTAPKLSSDDYRKQMSTEGKKLLVKTLSSVNEANLESVATSNSNRRRTSVNNNNNKRASTPGSENGEENDDDDDESMEGIQKLEEEEEEEDDSEEDEDVMMNDETSSVMTRSTRVGSVTSAGTKSTRRRRRHSAVQMSHIRTVSEVDASRGYLDDRLLIPPSSRRRGGAPFIDLLWLKGAGKSGNLEMGLYEMGAGDRHRTVARIVKHASRLSITTSFHLYVGSDTDHVGTLRQAKLSGRLSSSLFYLESAARDGQVLYTFHRKRKLGGLSSKIRVYEGKSVKESDLRYVLYFGETRICLKIRDMASTLGFSEGPSVVDWRPTDEGEVRVGCGMDLALVLACLTLCDLASPYASIVVSKEMKAKIVAAAGERGGEEVLA